MLSSTEEAQLRALIAQQTSLLSLASSEATIISKLAATKVSLADLSAASSAVGTDLLLTRQGTSEKSITAQKLKDFAILGLPTTIASTAESQAWTNNTNVLTPLRLKEALQGTNQSLVTSGYQKLPGGLIIQWGGASTSASVATVVSFPISFPTACFRVFSGNSTVGLSNGTPTSYSKTTTGFTVDALNPAGSRVAIPVEFFAVGY